MSREPLECTVDIASHGELKAHYTELMYLVDVSSLHCSCNNCNAACSFK